MLSDADRQALRDLCTRATPGPWCLTKSGDLAHVENSYFVNQVRKAVPELLDALEAAEQRIRDVAKRAYAAGYTDGEDVYVWDEEYAAERVLAALDAGEGTNG